MQAYRNLAILCFMLAALFLSLLFVGCASPVAPTPVTTYTEHAVTYAIHIPDPSMVEALRIIYPAGVNVTPLSAQQIYNYQPTYGRTNVTALGSCEAVAPTTELPVTQFGAVVGSVIYRWRGQFILTPVGELCP